MCPGTNFETDRLSEILSIFEIRSAGEAKKNRGEGLVPLHSEIEGVQRFEI